MASAAATSGSITSHSLISHHARAALIGSVRHLDASIAPSTLNCPSRRRWTVKPLHAVEPNRRSDSVAPLAAAPATMAEAVVEEKRSAREEEEEKVDYDQLARDLENASPLEIMDKALEKFGNDIAIAFRFNLYSYPQARNRRELLEYYWTLGIFR